MIFRNSALSTGVNKKEKEEIHKERICCRSLSSLIKSEVQKKAPTTMMKMSILKPLVSLTIQPMTMKKTRVRFSIRLLVK